MTNLTNSALSRQMLVALFAFVFALPLTVRAQALIPFDRTNPVLYLNDDIRDGYADEYLQALASAGDINLRGVVTQSSVAPFNPGVSAAEMEAIHTLRLNAYFDALASGFRNLPLPLKSSWVHLTRPASGNIVDTVPIFSLGGTLIEQEANRATAAKPLVIVVGGPLTDVADAYLRNPAIASKVIVAWLGGNATDMGDYNGVADPWSAYIALSQLRMSIFPVYLAAPEVTKTAIALLLPESPLKRNILVRTHPNGWLLDHDFDTPPAIAVMRPDYVTAGRRVSFGGFVAKSGQMVPAYATDANGTALLVTDGNQLLASSEWFRAMTNRAAYELLSGPPALAPPPVPAPDPVPTPVPAPAPAPSPGSAVLPQSKWSVTFVDSQETVGEPGSAARAFDGNPSTYWHTAWLNGQAPAPHQIDIDLGETQLLGGFRYLARQDAPNGRIASYEFYVSTDNVNWGAPVSTGILANSTAEQQVTFAPKTGRFIRLRAITAHDGTNLTTLAELNALTFNNPTFLIPQANWTLKFADSQELVAEHGAAINAFDDNPNTFWHTQWFNGAPAQPHQLDIDLGRTYSVDGFRYLARQDSVNGRIAGYEFYVSTDGVNWGVPVSAGTLANSTGYQEVLFTPKVGRFVRMRSLSSHDASRRAAMAELYVLSAD